MLIRDWRKEKEKIESHVIVHWVVYVEDSKGLDETMALGMQGREEINYVTVMEPTWLGI